MPQTIKELLTAETPIKLRQIEKTLARVQDSDEKVKAVLSALLFGRRTSGGNGLLGAFVHQDSRNEIHLLPSRLRIVGAPKHAQAIEKLRAEIPLTDTQIRNGILDWLDLNPQLSSIATALESQLEDIDTILWEYLKCLEQGVLNLPVSNTYKDVLKKIFSSSSK